MWVLANFWATWCVPCRHEIPALSGLAKEFRNRLVVLGISIDEHPELVGPFVAQAPPGYEVLLGDASSVQVDYNIVGVPENVLIDPNGYVRYVELGSASLVPYVHELLGHPAPN